jgi:hypothetical protein
MVKWFTNLGTTVNLSANQQKFKAFKQLGLPLGHYVITGSGPLGVRGLRLIGDIDVVPSAQLWEQLLEQYQPQPGHSGDFTVIRPLPWIEVFGPDSFYTNSAFGPTPAQQIAHGQVIDGLSFAALDHVLYFKKHLLDRPKDQPDIAAIEALLLLEEFSEAHTPAPLYAAYAV